MRIIVVGGGMQGRVIADNLSRRKEKPQVTIVDIKKPDWLPENVDFVECDVLDEFQLAPAVKGAAAAVLAVPSQIAHRALKNLILAGAHVADVSFTPDPPLDLDLEAKMKGSCCVVDCGIAPGLSHILVGAAYKQLGGLDEVRILVGGMPESPPPVFHHAVYFNPEDLIAEYVRPARARTGGRDIALDPLESKFEKFKDAEMGEFETFISDGLRSLLVSYPDVPEMVERTLRRKGHLETMRTLKAVGLFDGAAAATTAATLGVKYPAESYSDFILMVVEGRKGDKRMAWRVLDKKSGGLTAMSRATGFTTAAIAMLLAQGKFSTPGVHAPEVLGQEETLAQAVITDLASRGIKTEEVETATVSAKTR